jgi:hypothetical protein
MNKAASTEAAVIAVRAEAVVAEAAAMIAVMVAAVKAAVECAAVVPVGGARYAVFAPTNR